MIALQATHLALSAHRGLNTLRGSPRRGNRRQVRNLVLDRCLAYAAVIGARIAATGRRIDDEANLAVLDYVENVGAALADLRDHHGLYALLPKILDRALRSDDLEAELDELHRGGDDIVGLLGERDKHLAALCRMCSPAAS